MVSSLLFLFQKSEHSLTQEAVFLRHGLLWSLFISTLLPSLLLSVSYLFHQYLLSVYSLLDTVLTRVS